MNFQKPNPWVNDCVNFLATGSEHHLLALRKRTVRKVGFFDTLCFSQQAGLVCDTLCENLLGARLSNLLTHARAAQLIPQLFVLGDSNAKKRDKVVSQATRSGKRLLFWERLLHWLICKEHGYAYDSRVIDPLKRRLVIEALVETPGYIMRLEAHEHSAQHDQHHDFVWKTLVGDVQRWLPRFDFEFLEALLRAPKALERLAVWQWEEITFKYDVDHRDRTMTERHYAQLVRLCAAGVLHGLRTPDYVLVSFVMAIGAKPGSQPDVVEQAVLDSLIQLETIKDDRLPHLLTLMVPGCRRDFIAAFEAQPRYATALRKIEPLFAAKLVSTSPLRERWLQEYPEITEHVLVRELGL